jgi:hypothetical protein
MEPLSQFDQHGPSVVVVRSIGEFQAFFRLELEFIRCAHGITLLEFVKSGCLSLFPAKSDYQLGLALTLFRVVVG